MYVRELVRFLVYYYNLCICIQITEKNTKFIVFRVITISFSHTDGSDVEKAPFLVKPVRLTPAWEANNLSNDELNFKGIIFVY